MRAHTRALWSTRSDHPARIRAMPRSAFPKYLRSHAEGKQSTYSGAPACAYSSATATCSDHPARMRTTPRSAFSEYLRSHAEGKQSTYSGAPACAYSSATATCSDHPARMRTIHGQLSPSTFVPMLKAPRLICSKRHGPSAKARRLTGSERPLSYIQNAPA